MLADRQNHAGERRGRVGGRLAVLVERVAERDGVLPAFPADAVTATDVMITATAMLKAVNLQLFELGMWQAWSGRQAGG